MNGTEDCCSRRQTGVLCERIRSTADDKEEIGIGDY